MTTGESVDFNEFHSWELKKIVDLTDRIALFTSPYFSYKVKHGTAELELAPSDTKTLLDNPDLTDEENQAAHDIDKFYSSVAYTAITQAVALGVMEFAKGLNEEEIDKALHEQKKRPLEMILADSQEAWASSYWFEDRGSDTKFEVLKSRVNALGLAGQPINVEVTTIQTSDELLSEIITIVKSGNTLSVHSQLTPVQDELLSRLVKLTRSDDATHLTRPELYDAGVWAMIGREGTTEALGTLRGKMDDPDLEKLCDDLLERFEAVRATQSLDRQTNVPSADKLDETIELLEAIAESLEG